MEPTSGSHLTRVSPASPVVISATTAPDDNPERPSGLADRLVDALAGMWSGSASPCRDYGDERGKRGEDRARLSGYGNPVPGGFLAGSRPSWGARSGASSGWRDPQRR